MVQPISMVVFFYIHNEHGNSTNCKKNRIFIFLSWLNQKVENENIPQFSVEYLCNLKLKLINEHFKIHLTMINRTFT